MYVFFVDFGVGWVGYCWIEIYFFGGYFFVYGVVEFFEVVVVDVGFLVGSDVG